MFSATKILLLLFFLNACTLDASIKDLASKELVTPTSEVEVSSITKTPILSDSVTLNWTADAGAAKRFSYSISPDLAETCSSGTTINISNQNSLTLTGLLADTIYYFRVCLQTNSGYSKGISGQFKTLKSLSLASVYPSLKNWNDYVENDGSSVLNSSGVACTWNVSKKQAACLHGAELFKVNLPPGVLCSTAQARDLNDVFIWKCDSSGSPHFFYSTGILPKKGLRDLVTASAFKSMALIVKINGIETYSTPLEVWWQNPVEELPVSNSGGVLNLTNGGSPTGKIFVLSKSRQSDAYLIDDHKISVVTLEGAVLTENANVNPLITVNTSRSMTWIEGEYVSDSASVLVGIFDFGVVIRNFKGRSTTSGAVTFASSNFIKVIDSIISGADDGLATSSVEIYTVARSQLSHTSSSAAGHPGYFSNSRTGVIHGVTVANSLGYAIGYPVEDTIVSNLTGVNISSQLLHSFYGGTPIYLLGHNLLGINTGTIDHWRGGGNTYSQIMLGAASGTLIRVYGIDAVSVRFTNNMVLSHAGCVSDVTAFSSGITNATCALRAPSDANQIIGLDMTKIFAGAVSTDDAKNGSDLSGSSIFAAILDWFNFENSFRFWGRPETSFPSASNAGVCRASDPNCVIWDFRLKNDPQNMAFNRSDSVTVQNTAFIPGQTCPAAVDGNKVTTHFNGTTSLQFLTNAMEILEDGVGNENSLCESNEECIYTPNFGSYQGEGDYYTYGTCNFVNGTISNVKLYAYPTNGQ